MTTLDLSGLPEDTRRVIVALANACATHPEDGVLLVMDDAMYRSGYKSMDDWSEDMMNYRLAECLEGYAHIKPRAARGADLIKKVEGNKP